MSLKEMTQVQQKDVRLCHNVSLRNGFLFVLTEFYFFQVESGTLVMGHGFP